MKATISKAAAALDGQLAATTDGETSFAAEVQTHPKRAEIEAHEAIHRAQFAARGDRPVGTRAQLEREATRGAGALLAGRRFSPAYASPRAMTLFTPTPTVGDAARGRQWVNKNLTPAEKQRLEAFGDIEFETSMKVLGASLAQVQTPKGGKGTQVSKTRAAGGERATLMYLLRSPEFVAVALIPSARGGRSPDFYVQKVDGTRLRIEASTITQAGRGVRHSVNIDARGRQRQHVPRQPVPGKPGKTRVNPQNIEVSARQVRDRVVSKLFPAVGPNQLKARNKNTRIGSAQMNPSGILSINVTQGRISRAELNAFMAELRPRLLSATELVEVWVFARADSDTRHTVTKYRRADQFNQSAVDTMPARRPAPIAAAPGARETPSAKKGSGTEGPPTFKELAARFGYKQAVRIQRNRLRAKQLQRAKNPVVERPLPKDPSAAQAARYRVRIGAGAGAVFVLMDLANWYASLQSSELSRLASRYRNRLFIKMGGPRREYTNITVYLPPVGVQLVQWLLINTPTWADFYRFWHDEASGVLIRSDGRWVWRLGIAKGDPIEADVDEEMKTVFSVLDQKAKQALDEAKPGSMVRFKPGYTRSVWRSRGRGPRLRLERLATDDSLPDDPQFFVRGDTTAWRGLTIGTFLVVDGADLPTIHALHGQPGLIDPDALEPAP